MFCFSSVWLCSCFVFRPFGFVHVLVFVLLVLFMFWFSSFWFCSCFVFRPLFLSRVHVTHTRVLRLVSC